MSKQWFIDRGVENIDKEAEIEKTSDQTYGQRFSQSVFSRSFDEENNDLMHVYSVCLKSLHNEYCRKTLMKLFSETGESLAEIKKSFTCDPKKFQMLCDLIHNEYKAAAHVKANLGNASNLIECEEKIDQLLASMKDNKEFKTFFSKWLLQRGFSVVKQS